MLGVGSRKTPTVTQATMLRKLRNFLLLTAFAWFLGVLLGPPKYVIMDGYSARLPSQPDTTFQFAWRVNPLGPTDPKFARLGLYDANTQSFYRMNEEQVKRAALPFVLPGNSFILHLWWWIFPAVYVGYWLLRKYVFKPSMSGKYSVWSIFGSSKLKEALIVAQRRDTVYAYERVITLAEQRWLKPRRILREAQAGRSAVFMRYRQRLDWLAEVLEVKRQSTEMAGLFSHMKNLLRYREDSGSAELPLQVSLAPGWYSRSGEDCLMSEDIKGTEARRLNAAENQLTQYLPGAESFDSVFARYEVQVERLSKSVRAMISKGSADAVMAERARFATFVVDYFAKSFDLNESYRKWLTDLAGEYMLVKIFAELNADSVARVYRRSFEKALPTLAARYFSLYFPDETLHGQGQPLFLEPSKDTLSIGELTVQLHPTTRRFNRFPAVVGDVMIRTAGHQPWQRQVPAKSFDNQMKVGNDSIGKLDATSLLGAAMMAPAAQSTQAATSGRSLESILSELNDAAKEMVSSHVQDAIFTEFEAIIVQGIDEAYAEATSMAVEFALAGLSWLGED